MRHIGGMYKVVHLLPTGKIGRFSGQHRLDRKIDRVPFETGIREAVGWLRKQKEEGNF